MEIGLYTFGEAAPGPEAARQRLRDLIEEMELADQLGLEVYGVGEHHRTDYTISAPAVVLAAGAERTKKIRLTSAVSVLSSDDPVRVFQQFATLDLLSGGRAEIMAGRGSFTESFPLFGYDLGDYNELFEEKLDLLLSIRKQERITWRGSHRQPIGDRGVFPRPVQDPLPVWIAVGGTPKSVVRAGNLGLPLALAIIGGEPERFVPLIELYREAARLAGYTPTPPVGINSHGFVAGRSQEAAEQFYPSYAEAMSRIGRERGWPPMTRDHYELMRGPHGSLLVGSPQEVIDKMLTQHALFANRRSLLQMSVGPMDHQAVMRSIELLGSEVAPVVRREAAGSL
ncbi:MAG: LLM class flavin-dependent oxidoreductase [Actinomycetota bacterium]